VEVKMAEVGLVVDRSETWPEVGVPSHELRFGVPCDGTAKD
jgi:hypothetical protein